MEHKLIGYIAGDTFASRGNSHFADEMGNVICGTTNRFGMDCTTVIKFVDIENFDTDSTIDFTAKSSFSKCLRRNHLPLYCFVTCKKCRNKLTKLLTLTPISKEKKEL